MEFESDRGSFLWKRDYQCSVWIRMNGKRLPFGTCAPMRIKESLYASISCRSGGYMKNTPLWLPGFDC